jgi:phosphate-selective porin OprO/OprP
MNTFKFSQIAAMSALIGASSAFAASNDALLDLLVKKGVLTQSEASAVAAELKEEEKGVSFSAKGKETVKLRFNGRMQFQYDQLDGDYGPYGDQPFTNHFYFRRLFLGAKASLENGMYAETVLDFAGDDAPELAFEKAIFGYEISDALDVTLGYQKVPFGFEETSSSSKLPTVERSAVNRFFADDIDFSSRHTGIHLSGDLHGGFSYAVAGVNAAQGEGSKLLETSNGSNDLALFGRVQWSGEGLTVGVDGGAQPNNDVVGNDVTAFTGYVNYKLDGLNLLGEYFTADMDNAEDVSGFALRASYRLDKIEPVVRYSHVNTDAFVIDMPELIRRGPENTDETIGGTDDDTIISGDNEIDSFYVGLNYYYSPAVTFMAGYEMAEGEAENGDDYEIDGLRARVQLLW